ncbi:MAG TPA: hypothetical protein DCG38_05655 [Eubacteriaceae bacterium]|jgi:hypothetical protein|nr:hypothetical protein [Eubacteriaceae bacterium]
MTDKYEKQILNSLLDKYEKSKSFMGGNKVNQSFAVSVDKLFSKYGDHSNFEVFQGVNEGIEVLARKGLISAKFDRAKVCSKVVLKIDKIDAAYLYLGRAPKKDINQEVINVLDRFAGKNQILDSFRKEQIKRIGENKSVQFFGGDLKEFENILLAVESLLKVESETYARDFSVKAFSDSKQFEKLKNKVVSLLYEYGDFPEKDQVLESLNIVKNPTYVNVKGAGAILISGQKIDLGVLYGDIGISSSILEDIEKIDITGSRVMTIENLTSFHTACDEDTFFIYLGGFHNMIRREFIKKIYRQNSDKEYCHFGDIDAGGFYILNHLKKETNVDFKPFKMDLDTLKKYQDSSKKLTDSDRKRLKDLMGKGFDEVIEHMLAHDCKLEQEAVDFR